MQAQLYYEIAQKLEKAGYWKAILPSKCYYRLMVHMASLDSWMAFFSVASPDSDTIKTTKLQQGENGSQSKEMQSSRRLLLGEDNLLSFRVRVLLFDAYYHNKLPFTTPISNEIRETPHNYFFDDMYYTLECDKEDWEMIEAEIEQTNTENPGDPLPQLHNVDVLPLFESEPSKRLATQTKLTNRNSREFRSLLADVKIIQSWSNSDMDAFEELYSGLDKTMQKLKSYEEHSYPFLTRVRKSDAPDYYDIIKNPIDLSVMNKKIKRRDYNSKQHFQLDLDLMFANCRQYNTDPDSIYVHHATMLDKYAKKLLSNVSDVDCTDRRIALGLFNDSPYVKKQKGRPKGSSKLSTSTDSDLHSSFDDSRISVNDSSTPVRKRVRGRGRGRPKKIRPAEGIASVAVSVSPSPSPSPSVINDDDCLSGKDTEPSDSEELPRIAENMHEFLAEDPQIRLWRLSSLESRIGRVRDAHARELSPFENWCAIERTVLGMSNFKDSYTRNPPISYQTTSKKRTYLPENHICDVIPELPLFVASTNGNSDASVSSPCNVDNSVTSSQALLLLQKSMVILLTQAGFHGCHKIPFEVLSDLFALFFIQIGEKIQSNYFTTEKDIVDLLLHDKELTSIDTLTKYRKTANNEVRKGIEGIIHSDPLFDVSFPSPDDVTEMPLPEENFESPGVVYAFHNSTPKDEPARKKMRSSSKESPKKKRGRPKKKRTASP